MSQEEEEELQLRRLRMPRNDEVFGVVEQLMGASRMTVKCKDNNVRMCRIPGKIRRRIWIKAGDIVIVKPWSVQGDKKGDIVWRFTRPQVNRLMSQGVI
ncbi:MAG: translation initiation factor eIF-1A [Candidatus Hydrothermarchaeaceae archaeon]